MGAASGDAVLANKPVETAQRIVDALSSREVLGVPEEDVGAGNEEVRPRSPTYRPFWNADGNRGSRRVDVLGARILYDRPILGSRRRIPGRP